MKKVVLIIAFVFILLSVSYVSAVPRYNSAQSNIIANRIHVDVLNDVGNLLKEVKKAEPKEVAREIHVNVLSSADLPKEKEREPQPTAKEIHEDVLSMVEGINSPSSKGKVFRIGKAS